MNELWRDSPPGGDGELVARLTWRRFLDGQLEWEREKRSDDKVFVRSGVLLMSYRSLVGFSRSCRAPVTNTPPRRVSRLARGEISLGGKRGWRGRHVPSRIDDRSQVCFYYLGFNEQPREP